MKRRFAVAGAVTALFIQLTSSAYADEAVTIRTKSEIIAERESQARAHLIELHDKYDIDQWLFTREVIVEAGVIPHSHPVLTVNTRSIGDDIGTLATYLHEQFHWYGTQNEDAFNAAIADLRALYPDAPDGPPMGARNQNSTFLHLIICTLEFDAVARLFGETAAREELASKRYYRWIYDQVLENGDPVRDIMRTHGINLP